MCLYTVSARCSIRYLNTMLTWYGNKEFNGIPVTVERKLSLAHRTVRDEGLDGELVGARVVVHLDLFGFRTLGLVFHCRCNLLFGTRRPFDVRQRYGDDDPVARPHPQPVAGNEQGCDSDKRKSQLSGPFKKTKKVLINSFYKENFK